MNNELIKEATEAVDFLNEEWYDQTKDDTCLPFEFMYFSHAMGIKFMDQTMWDDQDFDREYIDIEKGDDQDFDREYIDIEKDIYEPVLDCVIRRTNKFLDILRGFKLNEK